ncbi:conserved hypothetical protein [Acidovorax delafieldii 2AN]|uniref:Integral membrane bound transporter domain-containing protein n=1 Tax=Acidovorax delafieldii 2AN TaxID=573060 RepID=C5T269_ACIDE|nr:conserved hypothetical protein [Acidovorax delafieldii 2AN]
MSAQRKTKNAKSLPGSKASGARTDSAARQPPHVTRSHSARHLLSPAQWQESLSIVPPVSLRIAGVAGLQSALAVLIALVLAHFSPWPHLVGFPALGALAALFGRFAPLGRRRMQIVLICAALLTLGVFLPTLASFLGAPLVVLMLILALVAGGSTIAVAHWQLGGPGAVIIVFAAGASLSPVDSLDTVAMRTLATLAGGAIAWITCVLTDHLRAPGMAHLRLPPVHVPPVSHQWIAGARIAVVAALAALIAHGAGWQHPSWAAIGATAVMQGGHLHVTMNRSLQRMAGTVVGAFVVWAILAQHPSFWVLVAAIVLFQFLTEVVIGFNYALGQITVTPMALLMTYLASPAVSANLPVERVLDTILGAALGIVFAVIFSSVDDRVHLHEHRSTAR